MRSGGGRSGGGGGDDAAKAALDDGSSASQKARAARRRRVFSGGARARQGRWVGRVSGGREGGRGGRGEGETAAGAEGAKGRVDDGLVVGEDGRVIGDDGEVVGEDGRVIGRATGRRGGTRRRGEGGVAPDAGDLERRGREVEGEREEGGQPRARGGVGQGWREDEPRSEVETLRAKEMRACEGISGGSAGVQSLGVTARVTTFR